MRELEKNPPKRDTPRKFPLLRAADPFPQSSVRALGDRRHPIAEVTLGLLVQVYSP
ncbi:hypothetical protein DPMN_140498 [Dreissena polymorpha]|uniref:Uncharacterized protein n=1 Tax=Dreissena polymorpha TaxID=45954 RepID=A0A9D4JLS6_DREPO|nr:hypothetical protein DPMN_140498 [Dreissena polymorpha]